MHRPVSVRQRTAETNTHQGCIWPPPIHSLSRVEIQNGSTPTEKNHTRPAASFHTQDHEHAKLEEYQGAADEPGQTTTRGEQFRVGEIAALLKGKNSSIIKAEAKTATPRRQMDGK